MKAVTHRAIDTARLAVSQAQDDVFQTDPQHKALAHLGLATLSLRDAAQEGFDADPVLHHPDDTAVDNFAAAMKAKLRLSREEKGRGGWDDPSRCSISSLAEQLLEQVTHPNPDLVDVGNFAMFLHFRRQLQLDAIRAAQAKPATD